MRPINIICGGFFLLVLVIPFSGCKKDFLDRQPLDRISSSKTFTEKALTEAYLYRLYSTLPIGYGMYGDYGLFTLANITDEARSKSDWVESNTTIVPGLMSPLNSPMDTWERFYMAIRVANNIILNLATSTYDDAYKQRITSEARFIRASLYFNLTRSYGGIPLITEPQSIDDPAGILAPRTPQQDIYSFIDKELTEIAEILPSAVDLPTSEYGRATREASWALNGRVLLYAKNYAKSAEFSKKVMDLNIFTLENDYNALFQSHGGSKEVIFEILFNGAETGHSFDRFHVIEKFMVDYAAQMDPTQEMVDAYEMTNGLPITDPASGYNPNDPYKNRDSRLRATIFYQGGASFKGYELNMVLPDGFEAPRRAFLCSITGYYIRKFMDESGSAEYFKSKTSWKELRLAEVLLNYAEAQNEAAGPDQYTYDALNMVRARSLMPELPAGLSKAEMKNRIISERRVELAFENFRWYDLIRWEMAESVLNGKYFHGMNITRNGAGTLVYDPTYLLDLRAKQVFQTPQYNLLPIPQAEIDKNPNLTQNPGY